VFISTFYVGTIQGVLIKVKDRNHQLLININHTPASTASVRVADTHGKRHNMKLMPLLMILFLASCAREGTYPLSGEECGPDDPVLTLDAADCMAPISG
jgi:hypothetical protein